MDLRFSDADEDFRTEARDWLETALSDEFASLRGRGGPGDEHFDPEGRVAWERHMGAAGWTCVGWPVEYGGRGLSITQQVIFYEEYARAGGPGRVGIVGEGLLGPTLIAFGSDVQKERFLPRIVDGTEIWCQGYSEPDAGSDLANVATRATRDGNEWVITGQKIWTSLAHWADWCFVLCRTDREAPKHKGLSYILVPMQADGITVRPIDQLTGTSEFNEVFFDGVRTAADNVVGGVDNGWKVAMGTLAFERGASTLGQQLAFQTELDSITDVAKRTGRNHDPIIRRRLADAWAGLRIMRFNTLRMLSADTGGGAVGREAMITKLYWATWHRGLGELAMDVLGAEAGISESGGSAQNGGGYELTGLQRLFLFTRADTIYGGSNQIQRNIIGERALGLPKEPAPAARGERESK